MNDFFIKKTADAQDFDLPKYATDGASGLDLRANVTEPVILKKGEFKLISTGVMISIPKGFEGQIRPRSGLALKNGITLLNSPGTIDSDYRGEIKVILINFGNDDFVINRKDRIAQLVICKIEQVDFKEVSFFDETARGDGGFGHTGI